MEFRKEISGVLLAVCAGVWTAVAFGQGQGPSLGDLMVPEADSPAKAAPKQDEKKPVETKPVETKTVEKKPVETKPVETKTVEKKPVETKPVETKTVETKKAEVAESDEINLNEIDDSAEAAKGRPVVKLAEQASPPDAPASVPSASSSSAQATHAPATGTEIAARFLAGDETALVDITSDSATLTDILRQFRRATGANIIYAESTNLQQRVSVSLKHVPWLQGMKSILTSRGFRVESTGGIHFIKEDKVAEPIFTRTFQLNHASVDELSKLFNESYGTKGKDGKLVKGVATPFQGANTIVVTASDRVLADCEAIIKAVDKAVPQIYIEARFIELSNEAMHKLGIQWDQLESWGASVKDLGGGMGYANGRAGVYKNGFTDKYYTPKKLVQTGSSSSQSSSYTDMATGKSQFDYTDNITGKDTYFTPKNQVKTGSTSSDSITFTDLADGRSAFNYREAQYLSQANPLESGSAMAWHNFRTFSGQLSADDFRLAMSAFEQLEDTKIFSNPKIIVSNGKEALFDRTTKFPHITLTSQHDTQSGYTKSDAKLELIPGEDELFSKKKTAFFSWGITLTVKPRISPDGLISVEIVPSISEPDRTVTSDGFYHITGRILFCCSSA